MTSQIHADLLDTKDAIERHIVQSANAVENALRRGHGMTKDEIAAKVKTISEEIDIELGLGALEIEGLIEAQRGSYGQCRYLLLACE